MFADWRVREALLLAFDFEGINTLINGGAEPRIPSYFGNSALGMTQGPAEGLVAEALTPFEGALMPGVLEGYALPVSDGRENRRNLRAATRLLAEAGWQVDGQGVLRNAAGEAFRFDILLQQGSPNIQTAASAF